MAKRKNKVKVFKDEVFGQSLIAYVGDVSILEKQYGYIDDDGPCGGLFLSLKHEETGEDVLLIWMPSFDDTPENISTLAHELHHYAHTVCKRTLVKDDFELPAYIMSGMLERILEWLRKK